MSFHCIVGYCRRVVENGEETVTVEENGVLTSKTIGGVQQAITGRK